MEWKTKCAIVWLGGESKRVTDYVIDFGVFYLQSVSISIVIVQEPVRRGIGEF